MPVQGYIAVRLCSIDEMRELLEVAEWALSEASQPEPELTELLNRLKATLNASSSSQADDCYLIGGAEW